MAPPISHALVLPDRDFEQWLAAARPYVQAFERVAIVRSPAGNDLNRFRNVTAVQTPGVWINDDALAHIRRAYPFVVRVDLIPATTPAQLQAALQTRINNRDRYGERQTSPKHIFDRFVLDFPVTNYRPARIVRPYSDSTDTHLDNNEGIDVSSAAGAKVYAAAAGTVSTVLTTNDGLNYGAYVQITSVLDGEMLVVTYGGLKNIKVKLSQVVAVGDEIAEAAGNSIKLVVQNPPNGVNEFILPNVVNPVRMVYWQGLRVRSTVPSLRIRSRPNDNAEILGTVTPSDLMEPDEIHGRTLAKLGVEGQWLSVRRAGTNQAYAAAWLLEARGIDDPVAAIPGVNIPGMNLDIDHPLGKPNPDLLKPFGWIRLKFNVSFDPRRPEGDPQRYGNENVEYTFNRYLPEIERYVRSGLKVILVLTHQTYGEGKGFVWPQMDTGRWRELTQGYTRIVRDMAARFSGRGLIYAYQIWNEQDTKPEDARAAVPMPVADYSHLLGETIRTIRSVDTQVRIITGGHVGGPEAAVAYAKEAIRGLPSGIRPDGVAFHPYGRGPAGSTFSNFGTITQAMNVYKQALSGAPVWITEWGALNVQGNDGFEGQIAQYADGFLDNIKSGFPGDVACACWYAWADGMDNGYGLVRSNNTLRDVLYKAITAT
ncbi:MAG: hypothetical protein OHK0046_08320 [Anaerolineae bacterium]